jgi:hypothetical protein
MRAIVLLLLVWLLLLLLPYLVVEQLRTKLSLVGLFHDRRAAAFRHGQG